jgi:hypothetical protein
VHRWRHYGAEVVTGDLLNGGNFAGIATRAWGRVDLGEDDPDRLALASSDWDARVVISQLRTRNWARGHCRSRPAQKNGPRRFSNF